MKVLHLIGGGDVGGAKVHVLSLVKELSKHIDVKIVSFRPGSFADDARKMGISIEVVKKGSILKDIKSVINILKFEKFNIIHSHGAKANMISLIAGYILGLPNISTVHSDYKLDYMHSFAKRISFGAINSVALRAIKYYIGVSRNFKEMLINRNFNPENIFTLYNGMDFEKPLAEYSRQSFSSSYNLNLDKNDIVVGIAARLYPVKGLDTLIKAAEIVVKHNPSVKFLIGGDGEDKEHLQKMTESHGISSNVYFLGWLEDPYELMSNVDISVLTSISESFPYSILEGARFKKATVSSRVGGIPDLIENGKNGYLFEPGDYKKLANQLLDLAGNPDKRKSMGEKIHVKASTQFSLKSMCSNQLEIYEMILHRQKIKLQSGYNYDAIISGYYGFNNIGDEAMLSSIIGSLKLFKKDIRIVVLSREPLQTRKSLGVNSISRINLFQIFFIMRKSKMFIYGGGNLIQDNTSSRSLMYYLATIWLAKKMHLKVMFYGHGFGPLNKKININLTRGIINEIDVISLREKLSVGELKRLNISKPRIEVTADPAFSINAEKNINIAQIFKRESIPLDKSFVGFSVRNNRNKSNNNSFIKAIANTADYISEKYNVSSLFIPMQSPVDIPVIEKVAAIMKNKAYVIGNKYSPDEIMSIIGETELFIGMRLHALIFAVCQHTPVIGIEYDPKIRGFLEYTDQVSAGNVNNLSFENLKGIVDDIWNNRAKIRKQLEEKVPELREKALENAKIAVDLISQK